MRLQIIKGALIPASDVERMELHKALKAAGIESKIGVEFDVALIYPRNAAFNAKIFAALGELVKILNTGEGADVDIDHLRWQIMYDGGWGHDIILPDGEIVTVLPSMSKTSMSEKELHEFWEAARAYVGKEIMIRLGPEQQARVREIFNLDEQNQPNPLQAG